MVVVVVSRSGILVGEIERPLMIELLVWRCWQFGLEFLGLLNPAGPMTVGIGTVHNVRAGLLLPAAAAAFVAAAFVAAGVLVVAESEYAVVVAAAVVGLIAVAVGTVAVGGAVAAAFVADCNHIEKWRQPTPVKLASGFDLVKLHAGGM